MKIRFLIISIISTSFIFSSNYNESIFSVFSSTRNITLGGVHLTSNNISSIFDAPLTLDPKYDNQNIIYLSYDNKYDNLIDIFHLSYCLYSSNKIILGIGLVNRTVNNNYNTTDSWEDNGDGIPQEGEINHNLIYNYKDQEVGLLISYNKILNSSILGINFKPVYHSIDNISSSGLSLDVKYLKIRKKGNFSIGINNLGSFKKWENGTTEQFDPFFYANFEFILDNILLSLESNSSQNLVAGLEYKIDDLLSLRLGSNNNYFSLGFGYGGNFIDIDYAYIKNYNSIFPISHKISFLFELN